MKRLAAVALITIANALGLYSASAQTQRVQAVVPFSFGVGEQVLPSGTYLISLESNILKINNPDRHVAIFAPSTMGSDSLPGTGNKLVFKRYGNQYFLREIVCDSQNMNRKFTVSKLEKKAQVENARLLNNSQTTVALK
jgi:hypothetical protein